MDIRVVRSADVSPQEREELASLVNDAFAKHQWLFGGERTDDEGLQEELAGADVILVAAEGATKAMGFVREEDGALYLGMVSVRAVEHGKGYGAAVLREAEAIARRRGLARVTLTTVPELGNQVYWERHGFRPISDRAMPQGYWGALEPWTLVTMEKAIPPAGA
jgi:GNAT superfamily N-acetyltransferase